MALFDLMWFFILVSAALVALFLVFLMKQGGKVGIYFTNAVRVWTVYGNSDARLAALTAAKVANKTMRSKMKSYLGLVGMSDLFYGEDDEIAKLSREISEKDWNTQDAMKAKNELESVNPEYASALDRSDPSIFEKKYPELFRVKNRAFIWDRRHVHKDFDGLIGAIKDVGADKLVGISQEQKQKIVKSYRDTEQTIDKV
jgi:hypothetical protein